MAVLGDVATSDYPASIDTVKTWEDASVTIPSSSKRWDANAAKSYGAALVNIQNELGVNPSGAAASVATRLSGGLEVASVQLTNAQILTLRATPLAVVAAQGANKAAIVHRVYLVCDATAGVYTEAADNLVIQYNNGTDITGTIETTGFIDQAGAVQARSYGVLSTELTPPANTAVEIFNSGAAEFGGGNAANTMSIRVWYSVVDTVAFT